MSANNVNGLLGVSMDKIKEMVDVNTVVGDPITTPEGTTVIPISRVNYGFAAGGSDLPSRRYPISRICWGRCSRRRRKPSRLCRNRPGPRRRLRRNPPNNLSPVRICFGERRVCV